MAVLNTNVDNLPSECRKQHFSFVDLSRDFRVNLICESGIAAETPLQKFQDKN
jgi:hypothetical protein